MSLTKPLIKPGSGYGRELSEEEKEDLIKGFLPFIKYTAYRLSWRLPPELSVDDLISAGIVGLLDALQRYKEGVAKLSTFVESRIRGAMLDELRSVDWIPKSMRERIKSVKRVYLELEGKLGRSPEPEEVAERLDMSLDEYYEILRSASVQMSLRFEDLDKCGEGEDLDITECVADPSDRTPLNILEESTMRENLARLIDGLPEKERLVLSLYYWEEMTMKEIGRILGITEGRVSQLHNQALLRLKVKLEP